MTDIDLSAPEVQDAITAAVEKATAPLLAKRDELLGEVKKLRKGQQIDPEDLARVEAERDEARTALAEATKAAKKAQQDAEKAAKALADAEASTHRLLVDNGLTDALTKANVTNPALLKAAKKMLADNVQVKAEGDAKVAMFGDKPLHDAIAEWAGSDEGKHFVSAPDISGGGSQGGRGNANPQPPKGNSAGSRNEAVARAQELMAQFGAEE